MLKLLHSRDIDAETAIQLLPITESELKTMIHKLIDFEMLHYVSSDVVELSEIGINYLMTNEKEKNWFESLRLRIQQCTSAPVHMCTKMVPVKF